MADFVQIGVERAKAEPAKPRAAVLWLQGVTLAWMLVEFGVAAYAAATAHSPALLAFGADSLVELLSATVVVLQWAIAVASFVLRARPETSRAGIAITIAALVAMPVLAALKRREAQRSGNAALAADAVQSATCAYLALITLVGLGVNAAFHIAWFDSIAALVAIPFLIKEGRSAWQGRACGCC